MKKEKRRPQPSRRRRTLRRVLTAAAVIFLVNRIFMVGLLFPIQAVRQSEEREGTGRTAVVCRDWAPDIDWSSLMYLTENENALLFSRAFLTPYGWMYGFGAAVDCWEPAPVHGGWWGATQKDGGHVLYVFGRVDSPDIARLEVQLQYEDWHAGGERRTALTWNSERADWMEKNGRSYFLFRTYPPFDWSSYESSVYPLALGYDQARNEIARVELDWGASSSGS